MLHNIVGMSHNLVGKHRMNPIYQPYNTNATTAYFTELQLVYKYLVTPNIYAL